MRRENIKLAALAAACSSLQEPSINFIMYRNLRGYFLRMLYAIASSILPYLCGTIFLNPFMFLIFFAILVQNTSIGPDSPLRLQRISHRHFAMRYTTKTIENREKIWILPKRDKYKYGMNNQYYLEIIVTSLSRIYKEHGWKNIYIDNVF